jgi:hypothetical protein
MHVQVHTKKLSLAAPPDLQTSGGFSCKLDGTAGHHNSKPEALHATRDPPDDQVLECVERQLLDTVPLEEVLPWMHAYQHERQAI